MITVLYAVSGLLAILLIGFAIVGDALHYDAVRRWWFVTAVALLVIAWLASAALR